MMEKVALACFGADPKFQEVLSVGQSYWPEWERYEKAARDIFSRRYYVSQRAVGPQSSKCKGACRNSSAWRTSSPLEVL